jgi:hypothetical protein
MRAGNINSRRYVYGVRKHNYLEYNSEIAQKKNKGLPSLWLELVLDYCIMINCHVSKILYSSYKRESVDALYLACVILTK